jgi:large subunit ribosomal protein L17
MRHAKQGRKLNRDSSHRKAMMGNMVCSLVENGRIRTTVSKAKEARPLAEKMVTLAKRGDLSARRQALARLRSKDAVHTLFTEIAPRFEDRQGGYTRIIRIGARHGDAAEMAFLEFVE